MNGEGDRRVSGQGNLVGAEEKLPVILDVMNFRHERTDFDLDLKLFGQLPFQASLLRLSRLYLAAGKLPIAGQRLIRTAPNESDGLVRGAPNNACGADFHPFVLVSFSILPSICVAEPSALDNLTPEERSMRMGRIRVCNTKPELIVRSLLQRAGYRFTVNGPKNRSLPGRPDIVLPRHQTVIFVHGCFWHHHRGCRKATIPTTRRSFWLDKFEANRRRDQRVARRLRRAGWKVLTVWECRTADPERLMKSLKSRIGDVPG